MSDNFDEKSDNTTVTTYATQEEIENIVNFALNKNSQLIQDRIINKLAKNTVSFLIGIIFAGFVIFKVLDNNIVITKENIELKAQVEKNAIRYSNIKNTSNKK